MHMRIWGEDKLFLVKQETPKFYKEETFFWKEGCMLMLVWKVGGLQSTLVIDFDLLPTCLSPLCAPIVEYYQLGNL
jgi:hypothetical protein